MKTFVFKGSGVLISFLFRAWLLALKKKNAGLHVIVTFIVVNYVCVELLLCNLVLLLGTWNSKVAFFHFAGFTSNAIYTVQVVCCIGGNVCVCVSSFLLIALFLQFSIIHGRVISICCIFMLRLTDHWALFCVCCRTSLLRVTVFLNCW